MPISIVLLSFHPQFIIGSIAPSALGPFSLVGVFFTSTEPHPCGTFHGGEFVERKAGRAHSTDLLRPAGSRSGVHGGAESSALQGLSFPQC